MASRTTSFVPRSPWTAGERLWDIHVPIPKLMTRNLAAIQMNESGVSNAGVLGLQKPKTIVDKVAFCKVYLRADRTEMVNRPAFGLSMFTGTLVALRKNLEARWTKRGAGIFHESLAAEFGQLADKYELYEINQILNMQDYPDDVLGRAAGLVVGGHWAMTLASTQQEGKYASAITEIPVAAREAKRTLLE
ncbi:FP1, partial [Symbiodinium pilosum]